MTSKIHFLFILWLIFLHARTLIVRRQIIISQISDRRSEIFRATTSTKFKPLYNAEENRNGYLLGMRRHKFFRIGNAVWVRRFVGSRKPKLNRHGLGAAKGYLKHVTTLLKRYCLSFSGVVILLKPLQSLSKLHCCPRLLLPLQVIFSR